MKGFMCPQCGYPMAHRGLCPAHDCAVEPANKVLREQERERQRNEARQKGSGREQSRFDPTAPEGTPMNPRRVSVAPPPFRRGYSMQHGMKLTSWSEYRETNKEMGMVDVGHCPPEVKDNEIK